MAVSIAEDATSAAVEDTVADEVCDYASALSFAGVEVTRTGRGCGSNAVRDVRLDRAEMVSGVVRFPVIGRSAIPDGTIAVILNVAAPEGSRWCGFDLSPGDVLVYGPGAEHVAVSPVGVEYRFAFIDQRLLDETAEALRVSIRHPPRRSVTRLNPMRSVARLRQVLFAVGGPLQQRVDSPFSSTVLAEEAVRVLADSLSLLRARQGPRIDSRRVVSDCVDYADAVGRIPSISSLCSVVPVSERRLRAAFIDVLDMPPNLFFRTRFLSRARERLIGPTGRTVTEIASDLGFDHLSRFASQYERQFGEQPHETLADHA